MAESPEELQTLIDLAPPDIYMARNVVIVREGRRYQGWSCWVSEDDPMPESGVTLYEALFNMIKRLAEEGVEHERTDKADD